ncbi:2572_t:CDS:2 [Dentiscutata erythropus]|uniref:2572_t:CDS:1 n=1 Tax=Dentiscutata erythropus TaxID=1348616 RepID=A0A9N8V9V6_9GLOM|nr:2572_t:CDS:2 [Dentiscutata erythropus]
MLNRTIYLKGFKPLFDKRRRVVKDEHVFMDRYGRIYDIVEKLGNKKVVVKRTHPPLMNPAKPFERQINYGVRKDKVVNLEVDKRCQYFKTKMEHIKQKYCNVRKKQIT